MTTGRPYFLPPWSADAIRELIDTLNCLNNGLYESPKDLSDCLHQTAESIRLVLDPDEFANDTPQLLDAIAILYIAVQVAANEAALFHPYPQDRAGTFERWVKSAIDTVTTTPGDQLRDIITGTVARLAQLRAELHHPVPHVVYVPTVPERSTPASHSETPGLQSCDDHAAGGHPPAPWPAWLTPAAGNIDDEDIFTANRLNRHVRRKITIDPSQPPGQQLRDYAGGGPPEGSEVSPEVWELGKSMIQSLFEPNPDDTPTAGDLDAPDYEEPTDVY